MQPLVCRARAGVRGIPGWFQGRLRDTPQSPGPVIVARGFHREPDGSLRPTSDGGLQMGEWLLLLAAVVLTIGTAVFVATEFSLVALDRPTVQRALDAGDARAGSVLHSLRALSTQLSAAQVGITLTTLLVGYLAQPSLGSLLTGPLSAVLPLSLIHISEPTRPY